MVITGAMERRIKLKNLNSYITCKICHGYLIDATTVTECLHTFCKSCLVKHLEEKHTCPTCQIVIHQSHPLQYISFDRTMQDIVYKLVPDLQESTYLILFQVFLVGEVRFSQALTKCPSFQMRPKGNANFTELEAYPVPRIFYRTPVRLRKTKLTRTHTPNLTIIALMNKYVYVRMRE